SGAEACAARSKSATTASITLTLRWRLKIARSGCAVSPGDRALVVVGQRLKEVEVAPVNQRKLDTGAPLQPSAACGRSKPPPTTTTRWGELRCGSPVADHAEDDCARGATGRVEGGRELLLAELLGGLDHDHEWFDARARPPDHAANLAG